jgi:hypothetical protein
VLSVQGIVATRLADWNVAIPAAEEARSLAIELSQPLWKAAAETLASTIAGFDPTDPARHPAMASWIIGDLAEAALHAGRIEEARARVTQIEAAAGNNPTVWIALGLRHARAVLADDEQAEQRFEEAPGADLGRWPFQRARLLLAHGMWLRRQRRITESRAPLRDARDAFGALGCTAFSDQARRELRASGEASRRRDPAARDTPTTHGAAPTRFMEAAGVDFAHRRFGSPAPEPDARHPGRRGPDDPHQAQPPDGRPHPGRADPDLS